VDVKAPNQGGKLENWKKEVQKKAVSVLGVSEGRWKGQGRICGDCTACCSGGERAKRDLAVVVYTRVVR
jgi:hypothetical protein